MGSFLRTFLILLTLLCPRMSQANSSLIVEETLLENHPVVSAVDRDDALALRTWLKAGHTPLAKIKNKFREHLIDRAANHASLQCFEILLHAVHNLAADNDLKDSRGTPLLITLAALAGPNKTHTSTYEKMIALMLSVLPGGVKMQDRAYIGDGRTALHQAASIGNIMVMQMLISSGADLNAKNSSGETALHFAARFNHLDAVKYLVAGGVKINEKSKYTRATPLMAAAEMGNESVIRFLMLSGAERDARDVFGKTAPERFKEFKVASNEQAKTNSSSRK